MIISKKVDSKYPSFFLNWFVGIIRMVRLIAGNEEV
jgi:hypothetical protein